MQQFINYNGKYLDANQPVIMSDNRAFRYGDALFETIRLTNSRPQFLEEHLARLKSSMQVLKMEPNEKFTVEFFEQSILTLAKKNQMSDDARIRLTVFRNEGGYYTPNDNSVSFMLEMTLIEDRGYVLNQKGFTVDLFSEIKKPVSPLSSVKSGNSIIYVMAGIYKNENGLDDCILINENGNIIEAISSNIFAVKNGVLYTAPVADGCVEGVMRKKVIEIAEANRIAVYELSVTQSVLLGADELFLTNAISGIKWVVGYKQKRYFNDTSKKLIDKLNDLVIEIVEQEE